MLISRKLSRSEAAELKMSHEEQLRLITFENFQQVLFNMLLTKSHLNYRLY